MVNLAKNWCRESQILEVRQAHPHTILGRVLPPGLATSANYTDVIFRLGALASDESLLITSARDMDVLCIKRSIFDRMVLKFCACYFLVWESKLMFCFFLI